jgi:hypothetical protein
MKGMKNMTGVLAKIAGMFTGNNLVLIKIISVLVGLALVFGSCVYARYQSEEAAQLESDNQRLMIENQRLAANEQEIKKALKDSQEMITGYSEKLKTVEGALDELKKTKSSAWLDEPIDDDVCDILCQASRTGPAANK